LFLLNIKLIDIKRRAVTKLPAVDNCPNHTSIIPADIAVGKVFDGDCWAF
jgi:hypothetical protein